MNHNWQYFTYIDRRGIRHADPYMVLVLKPIDPKKTSPTYSDIRMFVNQIFSVEYYNDNHLDRNPQLPIELGKIQKIIDFWRFKIQQTLKEEVVYA